MRAESYRERVFVVEDPDARLRQDDDLTRFVTAPGGAIRTIPAGTRIRVGDVRTPPADGRRVNLFVLALDESGSTRIGWTSGANLTDRFLSETIGAIAPEPGANRFGPNAAWANGQFLGQITLVRIVGTNREIEVLSDATADAFLAMSDEARKAGVVIGVNSGFRTYGEQRHLHDGFTRGLPGFNPANRPGHSNHQNGIALDLDVGAGPGNRVYDWMAEHATRFGFVRTVKSEPWHWELLPDKAAAARARGRHGVFPA